MRIAALDDDLDQLEFIERALVENGHDVHVFADGQSLLHALRREIFDLLIIDWQLRDMSGPGIVTWARRYLDYPLPVLFVTSRGEERDVVEGLVAGADDFMSKPAQVDELVARVRAVLRRAYPSAQPAVLRFGRYLVDTSERSVVFDGMRVDLKVKEFELAKFFFFNVDRVLSREQLYEAVWGGRAKTSSRTLDTHVSRLRVRLALRPENGYRLAAAYNLGYCLESAGAFARAGDVERVTLAQGERAGSPLKRAA